MLRGSKKSEIWQLYSGYIHEAKTTQVYPCSSLSSVKAHTQHLSTSITVNNYLRIDRAPVHTQMRVKHSVCAAMLLYNTIILRP